MKDRRKPTEAYVVTRYRPGEKLRRAVVLVLFTLVAAALGYGAGVTQSGSRLSSVEETREQLEQEIESLRERYGEARQRLVNLASGQSIDQQALSRARRTIVDLETELASLKADVTFYKNIMAPSETSKGLQVDRLLMSPARSQNDYRFKLVLTQVGNNKNYISGVVAVNVIGTRKGEQEVVALRDLSPEIEDLGVRFRFRYFQDVEGTLSIPEDFSPLEVQVVARAEGKKTSQAERTFDWQELTEN